MQVSTPQLRQHLIKGIQSIYFIYGDEPLQIRENTDMLRKAAVYHGFTEREVFHADKSFDWQLLQQASHEMSLFSSKKLIEIFLPSGKPGDKGSKAIIQYCQEMDDDNVLMIYTGELESAAKKTKWFKQIQASAVVVAVYPLKNQPLHNWLTTRLHKEGLQCDNESIVFLAELVEGNLLAADQEIIKLSLLYKQETLITENKSTAPLTTISLQQIIQVVQNNARYKGFDLFDMVLKGESKQVLAMLKSFQQEGTAIVWLLFIITKEIRMLAVINAYQQQMPLSVAMSKVYIFAQRKALIEQLLRNNSHINWSDLLIQLHEIDKQIKGVVRGEPWLALTNMLIHISQKIQIL